MSGLMNLVAYGAQDVYLTGNSNITFFKTVYRKHTDFGFEYKKHPDFNTIVMLVLTISLIKRKKLTK